MSFREMSVDFQQTARRYIPEDSTLYTLLIVNHTPSLSSLLTNLFISDLLGALLHSSFSRNS
jgi:hypothetical protein